MTTPTNLDTKFFIEDIGTHKKCLKIDKGSYAIGTKSKKGVDGFIKIIKNNNPEAASLLQEITNGNGKDIDNNNGKEKPFQSLRNINTVLCWMFSETVTPKHTIEQVKLYLNNLKIYEEQKIADVIDSFDFFISLMRPYLSEEFNKYSYKIDSKTYQFIITELDIKVIPPIPTITTSQKKENTSIRIETAKNVVVNINPNTSLKQEQKTILDKIKKICTWRNLIFTIVAVASLLLYLNRNNTKEIELGNTHAEDIHEYGKSIFPKTKSKDSLYILITRFDEFKRDTIDKNTCVGYSIDIKIDQLINLKKLPIKCQYRDNIIPPKKTSEAKELQKQHNADILIWGFSSNFKEECGVGEVCFMSTSSRKMLNIADNNFVSPEKPEINFEEFDSKEMLENGNELHINGVVFENWLSNMVFLKTEKKKPQFFAIDPSLPKEKKFEQFITRSDLFESIDLIDEAIKDLDSALTINSTDEKALKDRANLNRNNKNYLKALNDYNILVKLKPDNASFYSEKASLHSFFKNYEFAEKCYTKAIMLDSMNYIRYRNRAHFYIYKVKKYDLAEKDYTKVIFLDSLNNHGYKARARLYMIRQVKKYDLAEKDFTKAILLDSLDYKEYKNRAEFYVNRKIEKYDLAEKDYTKAILLDSLDSERYEERAEFYENKRVRKYDLAEKDYTKAILLDSLNYTRYRDRANFYKKKYDDSISAKKDYDKAKELKSKYYFTTKYTINNVNITELTLLGLESFKSGHNLDAEKYFSLILDVDSENKTALKYRSIIYYTQNKHKLSKVDCLNYIKKDSSYYYTYQMLGSMLRIENNYKEAVIFLSKSIQLKNKNPIAYNIRGLCFDKLGYYKKAELDYKKAITQKSNYYGFYVNLTRSYVIYQYWYLTIIVIITITSGIYFYRKKRKDKT